MTKPRKDPHAIIKTEEQPPGHKRITCACGTICRDSGLTDTAEDVHRLHVESQTR